MSRHSFITQAALIAASGFLASAAPCDIYRSSNISCVAAHSTTRALYDSYNSALYQVLRQNDGEATQIYPRRAGGVADGDAQDVFCANSTCIINEIYDQSGRDNHLTIAPSGGATGGEGAGPLNGGDYPASAYGAPVTVNGQKAYGVFIQQFSGYRNNEASGTATGDDPQGMYMVVDGTHYNEGCCFDYGNAELSTNDTGDAAMEAIFFGSGDGSGRGTGAGPGPWIMGDLENGLWPGDELMNDRNPTQTSRFVTAVVKGNSGNRWSIRGGDASTGNLSTYWDGPRPEGYNPMRKEGAILLGVGGDNSYWGQGTFYEGIMTDAYPPDITEDLVQTNIVAQNYAPASLVSGPTLNIGSTISIQSTSPGYTNAYLAHTGANSSIQLQTIDGTTAQSQATWTVVTGLGFSDCISLESTDEPGHYIRHFRGRLSLAANAGTKQFREDATFCPVAALSGDGTHTFRSWNFPIRNVRQYQGGGYIGYNGVVTPNAFDNTQGYNEDVSWVVRESGGAGLIGGGGTVGSQ